MTSLYGGGGVVLCGGGGVVRDHARAGAWRPARGRPVRAWGPGRMTVPYGPGEGCA